MTIRRELIDELLKDYPNPQDVLAEDGLLKQLTKAVIERCLETELDTHLGYPKHGRQGNANGNTRNGGSSHETWWRIRRTPAKASRAHFSLIRLDWEAASSCRFSCSSLAFIFPPPSTAISRGLLSLHVRSLLEA